MGALVATVNEDGTLQTQTTSGDSLTQTSKSSNSTVDSDTFLTLLIAEMQNQDPLEPTSNTEWVSQYATFTQVEQMSEMSESIDLLRANELVGKEVIMKVTSASTGDVTYAKGKVDYVTVENGKAILIIDGNQYALSDLDTVISDEYSDAYDIYTEFVANIDSLPDVKYADTSYVDKITKLYEQYNFDMDDYQKNFMVTYASSELDTLTKWVEALSGLGVEFKTEETTSTTTLDDVLESFNTKMNAILEKLEVLAEQGSSGTSSGGGSSETASSGTVSDTSTNTSTDTTNTDASDEVVVSDEAVETLLAETESDAVSEEQADTDVSEEQQTTEEAPIEASGESQEA
jgi:flagellar basal-body rod modification protein FlgD